MNGSSTAPDQQPSDPFFRKDGALFVPTACARGPWDPRSMHGRVIAGLLGYVLENAFGAPDFIPARLTVDMYRLPRLEPVEVKTNLIREGGRLRVAEAEFFSGGVSMAKASCQFLRVTEAPAGEVWGLPNWQVPSPEEIEPPQLPDNPIARIWAMRPIAGGFQDPGPVRQAWVSDIRDLVAGIPLTPFQRVALACDFASPFTHAGDKGLGYINSDVTLYLHRAPIGPWIGFEKSDHQATLGVAVGQCRLYDVEGHIGIVACAALGQRLALGAERPAGPRP
jgi:hypothetical protein